MSDNVSLTYEARAAKHNSATASRLLRLMASKQTNLCASLDVTTTAELLHLADTLGPFVCMVKTHIDIVSDFTYEGTVEPLKKLADKHGFLIFEDRKFADIGSTVKAQYVGGVYRIVQWADITNAHGVPGEGIVHGLQAGADEFQAAQTGSAAATDRGLIMLAELSSKGSLAVGEYTSQTVQIAHRNPQFVFGFIAQNRMPESGTQDYLVLTPGVGLDDKGDALGQQYRPVDEVVQGGSDVIIVGRGLFGKGRDPVVEGKRYRDAGWAAYQARVKN